MLLREVCKCLHFFKEVKAPGVLAAMAGKSGRRRHILSSRCGGTSSDKSM